VRRVKGLDGRCAVVERESVVTVLATSAREAFLKFTKQYPAKSAGRKVWYHVTGIKRVQ
jgi:hypothetical protein